MKDVFVAGVGMTHFGKFLSRSLKDLGRQAVTETLRDAGVDVAALDAAYVGNAVGGLITGQEMIRGQVILSPLGISGIPIFNVENACASASSAFHLAWSAVASGQHDLVLALGVEKLATQDRQATFEAIGTAIDVEARAEIEDLHGRTGQNRSIFMDIYADLTRAFMARSGVSREDFAGVVVKARQNAAGNEHAQYRQPTTIDEVLDSREVVWPLTLHMCAPIGDGAAAAIVASRDGLDRAGVLATRPRVQVRASVVRSGTSTTGGEPGSARAAIRDAYEAAGLGPMDLNLAEIHDATAPAELMAYEHLGLAAAEDTPALLWEGVTGIDGEHPVNPSGGLLCRGHPIGATGLAQICELSWQLRGRAGRRQVDHPRIGLTQNGGGWMGHDSAAMSVHILERSSG